MRKGEPGMGKREPGTRKGARNDIIDRQINKPVSYNYEIP